MKSYYQIIIVQNNIIQTFFISQHKVSASQLQTWQACNHRLIKPLFFKKECTIDNDVDRILIDNDVILTKDCIDLYQFPQKISQPYDEVIQTFIFQ